MKVFIFIALMVMNCDSFQHQFVNDCDTYETPTLHLISNQDYDDRKIHNRLIKNAREIGFRVQEKELNGMDTIDIAKNHSNVINLRAKKFYSVEKCLKYLQSNLVFLNDDIICEDNNNHDFLLIDKQTYSDQNYLTDQKTVTLVSASLLKYNKLIDIILNYEDVQNVVICLPEDIKEDLITRPISKSFPDMKFNFERNCTNLAFDSNILAIVAKSPFRNDSTLPIAFYGTSNFLPEYKDWYPNSINFMTSWEPLKYGLVTFLNTMKWSRVGIVTDDDEYSDRFLKDLIPLFVEKRIVFNVQECSAIHCDFTHALLKLRVAEARIIFLNVGEKNADKLMQTIAKLNMYDVKWIVRGWPFKNNPTNQNNIFSITLSPVYLYISVTDTKSVAESKSVPYLSSIIKALDTIKYSSIGSFDRDEFRRDFMKYENQSHTYVSHVFVIHNKDVVCAMKIVPNDVIVLKLTKIFDQTPSDLPMQCLVRSNDFFEPCNHKDILLLLLIIIMFILMFFIIIVFFSKKQFNYNILP